MKIALKMIKLAKMGGADAIKFQYYKAETLASKNLLHIGIQKKKNQKINFNYLKNTINLIFLISKNYIKNAKNMGLILCALHLILMAQKKLIN